MHTIKKGSKIVFNDVIDVGTFGRITPHVVYGKDIPDDLYGVIFNAHIPTVEVDIELLTAQQGMSQSNSQLWIWWQSDIVLADAVTTSLNGDGLFQGYPIFTERGWSYEEFRTMILNEDFTTESDEVYQWFYLNASISDQGEITPPEHTHSFGDWHHDETYHWKECECGEESERDLHSFVNNICTQCGYKYESQTSPFLATKIKIKRETVKDIIIKIFESFDYPVSSDDKDVNGKKLQEILNVQYYTFKHRIEESKSLAESLERLNKGYCQIIINNIERTFAADDDQISVEGVLKYWLQSEKIEFLEDLIEECNINLQGTKIRLDIKDSQGVQSRKVALTFGALSIVEFNSESSIGEAFKVDVPYSILINPDTVSYEDYSLEINGESFPIMSFSVSMNMTTKAIPLMLKRHSTGTINLSKVKMFNFTFPGYASSKIIDELTSLALNDNHDNNKTYRLKISRKEVGFIVDTVIDNIQLKVDDGPGVEIISVSFAVKGKNEI